MEVVRAPTASEFLELTSSFRAAHPYGTNVIGSVALSILTGLRTYDDQFWWMVRKGNQVIGLAMRTPPHGLLLGPGSPGVGAALAHAVLDRDPDLPSVNGPTDLAQEFCDIMAERGEKRATQIALREFVQVVDRLIVPTIVGCCRVANIGDESMVLEWGRAFAADVAMPVWSDDGLRATLRAGQIYLWIVDGEPVSMAGHAVPVPFPTFSVARVGPVYTPAQRRGHGYAAAVTAAVTTLLQGAGHRVMLLTDATNATSNGVYRRLGYEVVAELTKVDFLNVELSPMSMGQPA